MEDKTFSVNLRVEKDIRDFLLRYKQSSAMSSMIRKVLREFMERQDPVDAINVVVAMMEGGDIEPKRFIALFDEMKTRYRKTEALYSMANERIDELEKDGIIQQALGRLRLQEIDRWID